MLNLGTGEVLVILVVALLVLGPDKLPGAARQAGRWLGELRRLSSGFQAELRDALQEPVDQTPRSTTTTSTTTAAVPPPQDQPEPDPGPG